MKKTIERTVLLFAAILFLFAASCSSAESSSEEVFDTDLYSVDKNVNLDYSALIANTLFEPLDGFGEEELKAYYLRYYYHDERDYDLAKEVFENGRYTFLSDGFRAPVVEALYGNHTRTVAEVLDATEESQNERVLKYIVPTVESLEEIFGAEALENN